MNESALEQLCLTYWYPLYVYTRRRGYDVEEAKDLTQEFFARLLQHNRIARADQERLRHRQRVEPGQVDARCSNLKVGFRLEARELGSGRTRHDRRRRPAEARLAVQVVAFAPAVTSPRLLVLLVSAGIALILLTDTEAGVIAGAGSIIAGFGLSWRGLGRSLGGLADKLEQPLWGAELDKAITQAITLLPREQGRDVTKRRRDVAVALRRDEHPSK